MPPSPPPPAAAELDRINLINVGLMLGSAALACVVPFEMFLVAYAVLGPLHYLTQISWLRDRGWFTTGRHDWVPLAGLALVSFDGAYTRWIPWAGAAFVALLCGCAAAFARRPLVKLAVLVAAAALAGTVYRWQPARIGFAALLPTVIHVYVFTGLFLLAGSLKSRSVSGWLSMAVFVACGAGLLLLQPATTYRPSDQVLLNLRPFDGLLASLMRLTGEGPSAITAVGRFLAFAYTYHYLNWFSKTRLIRWHEMSRRRLVGIGVLWAASIALYAWDYAIGLAALFVLSMAHAFLEFPLDARTLAGLAGARRVPAVAARPNGARERAV